MIKVIIAVILQSLVHAQHTKVFDKYWNTIGNQNNFFFVNTTFGHLYNPCGTLSDNRVFRTFMNNITNCTGNWCINSQFKCRLGKNADCYHVEHIIDRNGPELDEFNKDIFGNLVMSYGRWNMQMGHLQRANYTALSIEKTIVYGNYNVELARYWIQKCNQVNTINNTDDIFKFILFIVLLLLFIMVYIFR